ncbi:MAG TPA: glycosyltransferase family 4 protein, partial [Symbiobacteriaceae bacterium]|nr:glycosyltransferase family 4 protein [Symbiobacteriaceae bacterium]
MVRPLRILKIINSFHPKVGGGERQAERLAAALVQRGHSVTVLTRRYSLELPAEEALQGFRLVRVGHGSRWSFALAMLEFIRAHRHEIDVIHAHQSATPLVVGSTARRLWGIPLVCTPMNGDRELYWTRHPSSWPRRRLFGKTNHWIAKSEEIARILAGFTAGNITQIPNGVNTALFAPRTMPANGDLPTAVYVGRLLSPKRVDWLLEAWSRLTVPARLIIVGDGPLRSQWEEMAKAKALHG